MKIRLHQGEIDEPPKMKGGIVQRSVFTGLYAFAKRPRGFLVGVRPPVSRRKHGFDADLLAFIAEQLRHALSAFDEGEGLLRLADRVVTNCQIAQSNELVLRAETLFETLEKRYGLGRSALLDQASRFEQGVLRRRWRRAPPRRSAGFTPKTPAMCSSAFIDAR